MSEPNSFAAWWDGGVAKPVDVGHDCAELAWKHQQTKIEELLAALELCLKNSEFRRASGVESGPMIEREIEVARAAINKAKGV